MRRSITRTDERAAPAGDTSFRPTYGSTMSVTTHASLPGRLGDPGMEPRSDPRMDPQQLAVLAAFGLDGASAPSPMTRADGQDAIAASTIEGEAGFEGLYEALPNELPGDDAIEVEHSSQHDHGCRRHRDHPARLPAGGCRRSTAVHRVHPRRGHGDPPGPQQGPSPLEHGPRRHGHGRGRCRLPQRRWRRRPAPVPRRARRLLRRRPVDPRQPRRARHLDRRPAGRVRRRQPRAGDHAAGQARRIPRRHRRRVCDGPVHQRRLRVGRRAQAA